MFYGITTKTVIKMRFYAKGKKRYTYEYANYVFDDIDFNISLNVSLKIYLLKRIEKVFSGFVHDLITERELMHMLSECFEIAFIQSQFPIDEQITVNDL